MNFSSLASDTGITRTSAASWLSVLQASHLIFIVRPWFTNSSRRFIKTLKLYFCAPSLAAWFLGVRNAGHVTAHPQPGAFFENWVMTELLKAQTHTDPKPSICFLHDREGHEIETLNYPRKCGNIIGYLQWTDLLTGKVRRWIVRFGDSAIRITLESLAGKHMQPRGWTWVFNHMKDS